MNTHMTRRNALSIIALTTSFALLEGCAPTTTTTFIPKQENIAHNNMFGRQLVETVKSQLGVRYVLGGSSPQRGFDCSGLLWWAYQQHGVKIPRITKDQAYGGSFAPLDDLKMGDVLVFAQSSAPNSLHTGMYIGENKFIHSPNSRSRVREDSLTNKYWASNLAIARRFV